MQSAEIFHSNLEALTKHHPKLAQRLSSEQEPELSSVRLEMGRKGYPTLQGEDEKGSFYLHSLYDPVREAHQYLEREYSEKDINVVVVLGFGLGYTVEALVEKISKKMTVVVVEPDLATFHTALSTRPLERLLKSEQIKWVIESAPEKSVNQVVASLSLDKLEGWNALIAPAMLRQHFTFSKPFVHKLGSAINAMTIGHSTRLNVSEVFMANALTNLKYAYKVPGVVHFKDKWKDRPAVIVAAGPSLDKQLDLLREVQDQILLIAVGAAWRTLQNADIEPHIVVAVDPFPVNFKHFKDVQSKGAWLLADTACNTDVVSTFKGRRIFAHATDAMESFFSAIYGPRGILLSGGSVANTAFSFAAVLGASPIVLIGQDLGYTGGVSHASGNAIRWTRDDDYFKNSPKFREVPGYYGDKVFTNPQMDVYRYWFEHTIAHNPQLNVINATEGGVRIEGAQQMPFSEVIEQFTDGESLNIESLWPTSEESKCCSYDELRDQLFAIKDQLQSLERLAREAKSAAKHLLERHEDPHARRQFGKELHAVEQRFMKRQNPGKVFLNTFLQRETFHANRSTNLAEEGSSEHYKISANLHNSIHAGCERAILAIEKTIEYVSKDEKEEVPA